MDWISKAVWPEWIPRHRGSEWRDPEEDLGT